MEFFRPTTLSTGILFFDFASCESLNHTLQTNYDTDWMADGAIPHILTSCILLFLPIRTWLSNKLILFPFSIWWCHFDICAEEMMFYQFSGCDICLQRKHTIGLINEHTHNHWATASFIMLSVYIVSPNYLIVFCFDINHWCPTL